MLSLTNRFFGKYDASEGSQVSRVAKADRTSGINFIRVLAAFFVVAAHCVTHYFSKSPGGLSNLTVPWVTVLLAWLSVCVPLFFLLAGFILLRPGLKPAPFYKRRIHKLIIPLLAWSAIYIVMRMVLHGNKISLLSSLRLIYNGEVFIHLWFLYAMIGVYLALPILSPLADPKNKGLLLWFAAFSILLGSILPFFDAVLTPVSGFHFDSKVSPEFFSMSLGYVVMGAIARDIHLDRKTARWVLIAFTLSLVFTVAITFSHAIATGTTTSKWMGWTKPGTLVTAVCFFLLLKESSSFPARATKSLRYLSNWSFGLYVSHPLIMSFILATGWGFSDTSALSILVYFVLVTAGSLCLTIFLSKIPFLRRIV